MPGRETGIHKIGLWCNKSGHLSAKTPHFGKNQGEVSKKTAQNGDFLYTYPSPPGSAG